MTTFYFQVEMTKPSGHYWTIGLNLEAANYTEALRMFRAWAFGIEAASSLIPHLCNFSNRATPDRSYFNLDSIDTIQKELAIFMHKDHTTDEGTESLNGLVEDTYEPYPDMVTERPSTDDDCPF